MNNEPQLIQVIQQLPRKAYLLAVSGGPDSMCLAHLFHITQHDFAIAHVNFGLRGAESDTDEALVRDWAETRQIPFFIDKPNTKAFQTERGMSLQEAARVLRYQFFQHLQSTTRFSELVTAHQANDEAETMLLNLFRGTGLRGLRGIPSGEIFGIRPLLSFSREQIIDFIEKENIPYRTDASNNSDVYTRNALRNQVIPILETIFPNWHSVMKENAHRFQTTFILFQREIQRWQKKCTEQRGKDLYLFINAFQPDETTPLYLYETLNPYGFSYKQMEQIMALCTSNSGAFVTSATHRVIKHKHVLIVSAKQLEETSWLFLAENESIIILSEVVWHVYKRVYAGEEIPKTDHEFWFDADTLQFPLCFRPKQTGDYFYPLGLKKKKKVSRFFIDLKMPVNEKEQVWLMLSGERVAWVCGIRHDDRFKVRPKTREVLIFTRINDHQACLQNAITNSKNVITP